MGLCNATGTQRTWQKHPELPVASKLARLASIIGLWKTLLQPVLGLAHVAPALDTTRAKKVRTETSHARIKILEFLANVCAQKVCDNHERVITRVCTALSSAHLAYRPLTRVNTIMRWRWRRRCIYVGTHARCRLASIFLAENYCHGSTSIISQTLSCRHFGGACYTCHSLQSLQALPKNPSTAHTAHTANNCFLEQRHTVIGIHTFS